MKYLNKGLVSGSALIAALVMQASASAATCFIDNYNYKWSLNPNGSTATHAFYSGTMMNGSGTYGAALIHRKGTNEVSVGSNYGVTFHYLLTWGLVGGTGGWANNTGSGTGTVSSFQVTPCASLAAAESSAPAAGPVPGQ